jgi:hypothetical protein
MEWNIERNLNKGLLPREVHVAIYEGNIESISYMENPAMQVPKIDIIVANPEGLIVAQTATFIFHLSNTGLTSALYRSMSVCSVKS